MAIGIVDLLPGAYFVRKPLGKKVSIFNQTNIDLLHVSRKSNTASISFNKPRYWADFTAKNVKLHFYVTLHMSASTLIPLVLSLHSVARFTKKQISPSFCSSTQFTTMSLISHRCSVIFKLNNSLTLLPNITWVIEITFL